MGKNAEIERESAGKGSVGGQRREGGGGGQKKMKGRATGHNTNTRLSSVRGSHDDSIRKHQEFRIDEISTPVFWVKGHFDMRGNDYSAKAADPPHS